jgi:hypothetical protein
MQPITNVHPDNALPLLKEGIEAINKSTATIQAFPERITALGAERTQTATIQLCVGLLIVGLVLIAFFKRK